MNNKRLSRFTSSKPQAVSEHCNSVELLEGNLMSSSCPPSESLSRRGTNREGQGGGSYNEQLIMNNEK